MPAYSAIIQDDDIDALDQRVQREARRQEAANNGGVRIKKPGRRRRDANQGGQASWLSSVINLVNTIVGAGVLAMPRALSQMGILLGTFVIIWSGLCSGFGLYLQTRCARYLERGQASFFALSQLTYPNAAVVFDAAIAIKCFGVGISYLIIIGDLMPGVVLGFREGAGEVGYLVDRHFWITAFMLIVIPLSFLRRLDSLKYTSVIALVAIGYLIILVLAHFIKGDTLVDRGEVHVFTWQGPVQALASFPVIVFAYTCHQNMFSILNEIRTPSAFRTTAVVVASIGTACSIYILVAITGYLSYGDNIAGNIVAMYPPTTASTIGRAAIVVLVMFSYPLQVHPCRASLDAVMKWRPGRYRRDGGGGVGNNGRREESEMSDARFAIVTTAIIVASYVVAMTVHSLEAVLAYVGSTGSTSISFILPGLFYYKISDPESSHRARLLKSDDEEEYDSDEGTVSVRGSIRSRGSGSSSGKEWKDVLLRRMALALAVYGFVVMAVCLSMNIFFHASH